MSRFAGIEIEPALLRGVKKREPAATARLYDLLARPIHGLATRILGDAEAAADVTHDTFMTVVEKVGAVRSDAAFGGWVRQIAVNECLARLRSPWHKRRVEGVETELSDGSLDAGRLNGWRDLEQALSALPADTRFVVWMHEVEGYTHQELATLLDKSVSYSKSQLARGLDRLRGLVESGGVESGGVERGEVEKGEVHE